MLIYPLFVREGHNIVEDIPSLPGQKRYSPDTLPGILEQAVRAKLGGVLLFGLPDHKDELGSGAWSDDGVVQQAVRTAKREFPELTVIGDVCMCEYTTHGHCGILSGERVDNDATLGYLARIAVSQARAGTDIVAPSAMMDGQTAAIRQALDAEGLSDTLVFSYAVKYASGFYGPFREAAGSRPSFGDRKGYQLDPRNVREALREALLDVNEGADMIMVKPGLPYLDVLKSVKAEVNVPVGSYCVSGEYALIKAGSAMGYVDERRVVMEVMTSLARAGADVILTYHALQVAEWIYPPL